MSMGTVSETTRKRLPFSLWFKRRIAPNWIMYLFLLLPVIYACIFWYAPMGGLLMSFQRYNPGRGIWRSPFVGLEHFRRFFGSYMSGTVIRNTLLISLYSFLAGMPFPVLLALFFKCCPSRRFAKLVQTVTYAPYFISMVVLVAMMMVFLSPRSGLVNILIGHLGGTPINFMSDSAYFRHTYVWSGIWQGAGWGSIIYTAALAGVEPELYEAAIIDGASKLKRMWYIDIPVIVPAFIILQIMSIGNIMSVGYEKVYLMQNPANIMVSEVIATYTYTLGIRGGEVSYTTAIGLFNNVVNFCLLMLANFVSSRAAKISVV